MASLSPPVAARWEEINDLEAKTVVPKLFAAQNKKQFAVIPPFTVSTGMPLDLVT